MSSVMVDVWYFLPSSDSFLFPGHVAFLALPCVLHASWHLFWLFTVFLGLLLLEVLPQPSKIPNRSSEAGGLQPLWARGSNNCRGDRFMWPKFQLASMILHSPFMYFGNPHFLHMSALGVPHLYHLCLRSLLPTPVTVTALMALHWIWCSLVCTPPCELLEGKECVFCSATLKPQYKHRASILKKLIKSTETRSSCW